MENEKLLGYTTRTYCKINKNKSTNPLAKLTYKHLQKIAKSLGLPAKQKHKILLALVISKKQGRQDIVDLILATNKKKLNHKAVPTVSGERGKAVQLINQEFSKQKITKNNAGTCDSGFSSFSSMFMENMDTKPKEENTFLKTQTSKGTGCRGNAEKIINPEYSGHKIIENDACESGLNSFSSMFMETMDINQGSIITENSVLETQIAEATEQSEVFSAHSMTCDSGFSSFSSMFMENVDIKQGKENTLLETQTAEATVEPGEDIEAYNEERDLVSVLLRYTNTL